MRHFSAALIVELILLAVVVLEAGLLLWQPIEKAYQMDGQGRVQMLYVGSQSGQCQVLFKPHIENTAVTINDQALVALGSLKAFVPCGKSLLFNFREGGKDYSQIYKITQPVTILTPTLGEELSQSHLHFVLTHWYFKHLRLWEYFF